jgi:hypothetical protein
VFDSTKEEEGEALDDSILSIKKLSLSWITINLSTYKVTRYTSLHMYNCKHIYNP